MSIHVVDSIRADKDSEYVMAHDKELNSSHPVFDIILGGARIVELTFQDGSQTKYEVINALDSQMATEAV